MVFINEYEGLSHDPAISITSKGVVEDIKSTAAYIDCYSFFGIDVAVKFDSPEIRQTYRNRYRHFLINPGDKNKNPLFTFYIITKNSFDNKPLLMVDSQKGFNLAKILSNGRNGNKRLKMKGVNNGCNSYYGDIDTFLSDNREIMILNRTTMILERELLGPYLELIIFNSILSQVPNHFILHAGVVSWQERGIILCGDANSGKSTLTLSLVQNGFKFLSDEIAFIGLETLEVAPFPRALGLREDITSKMPELKFINGQKGALSLSGDMKWSFDVESVYPNSLGKKCKIGYLIFLDGFGEKPEIKLISKSDALIESLKHTHTSEDNPFSHLLRVSELVKETKCLKIVLGDRKENVRVLRDLVENRPS